MYERGYLQNTNINQIKLVEDFVDYYPKEFLIKLESYIDKNNYRSWLANIATATAELTHPIRHLLFIRFLFGSTSSIVNAKNDLKYFGEGPWPCLNPAADHYKELIINDCLIKSRGKGNIVIGIFKCSCGFIYSRKWHDKSENDKYRYSHVFQRGEIWENKLKDLILNKHLPIKEIVKIMKCSKQTILKYAFYMGIDDKLNTIIKYKPSPVKTPNVELYKKEIIEFIKKNPESNRYHIKLNLVKQYVYLYRHEKEWLESVLPESLKKAGKIKRGYNDEDWVNLDKKLCALINEAITDILNDEKPRRVTKAQIVKRIKYYGLQDSKTLEKLPNTKKLLDSRCETTEEYQKRINKI